MTSILEAISDALGRAFGAVGAIVLLLALAAGGLAGFFFGTMGGVYAAAVALGVAGALQVFHRYRCAELKKRRQRLDMESVFHSAMLDGDPSFPKVVEEFNHEGFVFRTLTVEEREVPLTVSVPLCPWCGERLLDRAEVSFPGRVRLWFECTCGWRRESAFTEPELRAQAARLGGVPKDIQVDPAKIPDEGSDGESGK
jgi:hypothetical protein